MKMHDLINEVNFIPKFLRPGKVAKAGDEAAPSGAGGSIATKADDIADAARARQAKRDSAEAGKGKTDTGSGTADNNKSQPDNNKSQPNNRKPTKKERQAAARQRREEKAKASDGNPATDTGENTANAGAGKTSNAQPAATDAVTAGDNALPDYIDTTLFGTNPPRPSVFGKKEWDEKFGPYLNSDGSIKPEFRKDPTGGPLDGAPDEFFPTRDAPEVRADAPEVRADAPEVRADAPEVRADASDTRTWQEMERDVETRGGKTFAELEADSARLDAEIARTRAEADAPAAAEVKVDTGPSASEIAAMQRAEAAEKELARMKELAGNRADAPAAPEVRADAPAAPEVRADAPAQPASTISVDNAATGERSFMDRALDKTGDLAGKYVKKLSTDPVKTLGTTYMGTGVVANTLGNTLDDKYTTFGQAVGGGLKDTFVDPLIGIGKAVLPDTVVNKLNKKFNSVIDDKPETPTTPAAQAAADPNAPKPWSPADIEIEEPKTQQESISTILKLSGQRPITERDNTVGITKPRAIRTLTENTNLAECGMGSPSYSQPASFSINASAGSGDEVANMLKSIMHLAGVKPVTGDMLGAEMLPQVHDMEIISASPEMMGMPEVDHDDMDHAEVIEIDGAMGDHDEEEKVGEEYDNTPHPQVDTEDPLRKWANVVNKNDMSTIPPGAPGDNKLQNTLGNSPVKEATDVHNSLLKAYEAFKNS